MRSAKPIWPKVAKPCEMQTLKPRSWPCRRQVLSTCCIRTLLRVFRGISDDRILANSAAVTFYALLALFPAIAALVSIYGLFMSSAIRLWIPAVRSHSFLPG